MSFLCCYMQWSSSLIGENNGGQNGISIHRELDGVPRTQTSRLLLSYTYTTAVEATALFVQQQCHVKGAIIVDHVTPPHGKKWLLFRMIVRELQQ